MYNKMTLLSASILLSATPAMAMEFEVSGQLNMGVLAIDDGERTETYIVDNSASSSRFRFTGNGNISEDLIAGFRYEMEFESNASQKTGTGSSYDSADTDKNNLTERYADIYLRGSFGEVYLGQGDGAANGMTHVDLSGTNVAATLGNNTNAGGTTYFLDDEEAGPTVVGAALNWDFESRYDRLQYISPKLGPVTLSASAGRKNDTRGVYETSLAYASQFGFGKVAAGIGYSTAEEEDQPDNRETVGGSVSVLLNSGFNGAVSYSRREASYDYSADNITFRLGYKSGRHATSVDYGVTNDRIMQGDEADVISLNYVYQPVGWMDIYATARQFSLDRADSNYEDVTAYMIGSRIKF